MFLFYIIRYFVSVYYQFKRLWNEALQELKYQKIKSNSPDKLYFLSDDHIFDQSYTTVPEDTVYVEEWVRDGVKKCCLYYEGQLIPHTDVYPNPFDHKGKTPWLWIGDKTTEVELTQSLQKFVVAGNKIKLDLLLKLIQVKNDTELVYIDPVTLKECKFPNDGITILKDEEPVSNS